MGPNTTLLCDRLAQTIELLESAKEVFWAAWLRKSLNLIQVGDFAGIEHLHGAFGGMGSFNDVILAEANGNCVHEKERLAVNEKLGNLQTELYTLVQLIRHDAEISGP
jgi:hypothetical protein